MPIRITCKLCTTTFLVNDEYAGKRVACPQCATKHLVEPTPLAHAEATDDEDYQLSPLEPTTTAAQTEPAATHTSPAHEQGTCPNCGRALIPGVEQCKACYFHVGLGRIVDTRDPDDPLEGEYGFRRYLLRYLNQDQSPESVFLLADTLMLLGGVLLFVLGYSLAYYVGPLILFYLLYRIMVRVTGMAQCGRSLLWRIMLLLGRSLDWRTLRGTQRSHITRRDATFGDTDLASLEELDATAVLDLEGSAVTAAGLKHLRGKRNLQFVILRNTQIDDHEIWELQQTIPDACIWY